MKKMLKFFAAFCLGVSITAGAESDVKEYTLDNGLTLLVKEDHRAPIVNSFVWYKVGSSYEPNGITGVSHALEHMMFKGTPKHPGSDFFDLIAAVGGEQNAFTSQDYTAYYQKLSADQLPLSFELEADRMANLSLPAEEFAKEIEVVKEERRIGDNNPQSVTYERFLAGAYLANPYHHPIIGWQGDLDNMQVDDLRGWYQAWYTPNNAIVVVVGDVKPDAVHELAKKHFGSIKSKPLPTVKPHPEVPQLGTRKVEVNLPAKLPYILMGYNVPSVKTAETAWEPYALDVLSGILSSGNSARLQKNLLRGQQIATELSAQYDLFSRLSGLFIIAGTPAPGHTIAQLEAAILQEVANLQQEPVTEAELNRVKAQAIASKTYAQDSGAYQAMLLGSLASVGLPWQEIDRYPENIKAVTAEQVQQVAEKYLTPSHLTIAYLNPQDLNNNAVSEADANTAQGGQHE